MSNVIEFTRKSCDQQYLIGQQSLDELAAICRYLATAKMEPAPTGAARDGIEYLGDILDDIERHPVEGRAMRMALEEIRQRDLAAVCHHESGHLVALTQLGGRGSISVAEADGCDELRLYAGNCQILTWPATERGRILVGLAGAVAEELLDDFDAAPQEIMERIDESMSDSDARLASGYTQDDVQRVVEILRDNWADVQFNAKVTAQAH